MDDVAPALSMGVTAGVIALVVALAAASGLGLVMRRRASGIMKPAASPGPEVLTAEDLGGPLGPQATLVQFSTAFCAPCRPTRQLLTQVADMVDGVRHVDIDAAERLDLVRRLRISSTPTVLVLDQHGAIVKRATGLPRKVDVIAALGTMVTVGSDSPVERA